MTALSVHKVSTTLTLRSEEHAHLLYVVEIENASKTYHCFSSENYFQALLVAKKIFSKFKTKEDIGDLAVMIEAQHGRGICYDVNQFSFDSDFENGDHFYKELCNEFEYRKFKDSMDNNTLFRKMASEMKLNEYQEQQFLYWLKKLDNV